MDCCSNAASQDNDVTLSQFVNNSSDYLTNNTTLVLAPENHNLESELLVEMVHSFSMFAWPASSSKAVITCGPNARLEFRNVSIVTVSGLKFVGCFETYVKSVSPFQLQNSGIGNSLAIKFSSVLIINESAAEIYDSRFVVNVAETMVYVTHAHLVINHCTFTSNIGSSSVLDISNIN